MTRGPAQPITVVTGVPRSGTSLVMQMLRAGGVPIRTDGVRAPDADNPRGYLEFEPARSLRRDASWVPDCAGRAVKVVHALVPALPDGPRYRVILVRRRLDEVVASQRAMLARRGQGGDESALGDARLVEVFRAQLEEVECWAAAREAVALLRVDYEAALRDPGAVAAKLARFLGGGLDERAMAAAVDSSLHRHRASGG